ncbi:MAG TPA: hypothetical protein VMB03_21710 [Bryobacteraceae bacterium]|nr:hypothetical protein [Bryobacteraceae bacterium]
MIWEPAAAGTYPFQYQTGIVIAAGTTQIALAGPALDFAYMFGYLTSN